MRQFKLKLNNKNFKIPGMINLFIVAILMSSFAYGYFVLNSISNTVERENLDKKISSVSTKISSLEAEYLKLRNGINIEVAFRQGFKEDFNKINFANVDSGNAKGGFSFLSNEI